MPDADRVTTDVSRTVDGGAEEAVVVDISLLVVETSELDVNDEVRDEERLVVVSVGDVESVADAVTLLLVLNEPVRSSTDDMTAATRRGVLTRSIRHCGGLCGVVCLRAIREECAGASRLDWRSEWGARPRPAGECKSPPSGQVEISMLAGGDSVLVAVAVCASVVAGE